MCIRDRCGAVSDPSAIPGLEDHCVDLTAKNCEQEETIVGLQSKLDKAEKQLAQAQKKVVDANELRQRELKKRD